MNTSTRPTPLSIACLGALALSACGVERVECVISADCGYGQRCTAGRCVQNSKADCSEDDDCPIGEYCTTNGCVPDPMCIRGSVPG